MRFRLNPTRLRFRPFAIATEEMLPLVVEWNIARVRDVHQVQVQIRNDSENIVTNVRVSLDIPGSLEFIEPKNENFSLGTIRPGDTAVALYILKAKSNTKARLEGTILYVDYKGRRGTFQISPVEYYFDVDISSIKFEPQRTTTETVPQGTPQVNVYVGDQVKEKPVYQDSVVIDKKSVTTVNQGEEKPTCPNCQEAVDRRWKICPNCQAQLRQAETRRLT